MGVEATGKDFLMTLVLGYFSHFRIFPSIAKSTFTKSNSRVWLRPSTEGSLRGVRDGYAFLINRGSPSHKATLFVPRHF